MISKLSSNTKLNFDVDVMIADRFWQRAVGLLSHASLPMGSALLIKPCKDVHTFFMRFNIDILFLDKEYRVLSVRSNIAPYRFVFGPKGSIAVLEMGSGAADAAGIDKGHVLGFNAF